MTTKPLGHPKRVASKEGARRNRSEGDFPWFSPEAASWMGGVPSGHELLALWRLERARVRELEAAPDARAILRKLARGFALSDHIGDAHEVVDEALVAAGLPEIPVGDDGRPSYEGWLEEEDPPGMLTQAEVDELFARARAADPDAPDVPAVWPPNWDAALGCIDEALASMSRAWPMWAGSETVEAARPVEHFATTLLELEFVLTGRPFVDWRKWRHARYPHIPGPVRCVAEAAWRASSDDEQRFSEVFQFHLREMIQSARRVVRADADETLVKLREGEQ